MVITLFELAYKPDKREFWWMSAREYYEFALTLDYQIEAEVLDYQSDIVGRVSDFCYGKAKSNDEFAIDKDHDQFILDSLGDDILYSKDFEPDIRFIHSESIGGVIELILDIGTEAFRTGSTLLRLTNFLYKCRIHSNSIIVILTDY